jgi:hypothetical protein
LISSRFESNVRDFDPRPVYCGRKSKVNEINVKESIVGT